ncbi:MAG: ATP-binding protein, partial [Actinobacteria bacterium]|nr:ATP-binding protein [Actinomycetota bacterium]
MTSLFVNRERELSALRDWWDARGGALGLVWGRRRVGKTALLTEFARDRRAIFHTAS